jgi:capsular polysaccharide biosynthesis protein
MEELDLKELFTIFWERKTQAILIILVFAIIGMTYSYFMVEPDYKATTKLVLTQSSVDSKDDSITQADVTLNSKLVSTYGEIIKTDNVLKTVVNNINNPDITIKDIKENVTVKSVKETELLEITVKNANPNYAAQIANEIAKVFCERVVEIYSISNTYVLDRAEPDATPYNINHIKDIAVFAFIGVIVAVVYILIANMLDNTIKTEQDIEKIGGLLVLSTIPDYSLENKRGGRRK